MADREMVEPMILSNRRPEEPLVMSAALLTLGVVLGWLWLVGAGLWWLARVAWERL